MKLYSAVSLFLLLITISNSLPSQDAERAQDEIIEDAIFQPQVIDSVLTIDFPTDQEIDADTEDGIRSFYWYGYDLKNDRTYMIHKAYAADEDCINNLTQLKDFYRNTTDEWATYTDDIKVLGDKQFERYGLLISSFTYTDNDIDTGERIINDFRLIQVHEELYQIGIIQPLATLNKSENDAFFNSIIIKNKYTGNGQFKNCSNGSIALDRENKTAYQIGTIIGGILCVLIPLGIVALVIVLIVRNNKRKKMKNWEDLNS